MRNANFVSLENSNLFSLTDVYKKQNVIFQPQSDEILLFCQTQCEASERDCDSNARSKTFLQLFAKSCQKSNVFWIQFES